MSAKAHREWESFRTSAEAQGAALAFVRVIEERPVSLGLAERIGVKHESPQALLIKNGKALWHTSHHAITAEALKGALSSV